MRYIVAVLLISATLALAQTPKAPSPDQYALSASATIAPPGSNKTEVANYQVAVDRINKRLSIYISSSAWSYLMIYNAQWDASKLFYVMATDVNQTNFKCVTYKAPSADEFFKSYDLLNTFARNAQYTGKAIALNPMNFVEGANAFALQPNGSVVAYFCQEKGMF